MYDIKDQNRWKKVYDAVRDFGSRHQYSVFICNIEKKDYLKLKSRLLEIINKDEDLLCVYLICQKCEKNKEELGKVNKKPGDNILL
jgi:CRISPR-associated protein Cas2